MNAGLRTAIRRAERSRRNSLITLAVVTLVIVTVLVLDWPRWILWACAMPLLVSGLAALGTSSQIAHSRERIIPMPMSQQSQEVADGA